MMKRSFLTSVRTGMVVAGCAAVVGMGMVACSKSNDYTGNPGNQDAAGLMAFNLSDKNGIGVSLSGSNLVNNAIGYNSYTGGYLPINPGAFAVRSFDATGSSTLAETQYTFAVQKYYTLVVTGANGTYRNVLVRDNYDSLSGSAGKAYVRYVNAIPDSVRPAVTITAGGQPVIADASAAYTNVSNFVAVSGDSIKITASNGGTIQATRTFKATAPKVYTILLTGIPGSTDTTRSVKISYIENGTLNAAGARTAGAQAGLQ